MTVLEVSVSEDSRTHGYNEVTVRYVVDVTMFGENVTLPVCQQQISRMIHALYPDTTGHGASHMDGLSFKGVVRVEQRPSTRQDGVPWDFHVGRWVFDYVIRGND